MNEIFNKLDDCVHCGLCLSDCPTYLTTGLESESPRGRLMIMKMVHKRNEKISAYRHLDTCLDCRGCVSACPSGVEYDLVLDETRKKYGFSYTNSKTIPKFLIKLVTSKYGMKFIHKFLWILQILQIKEILTKIAHPIFNNLKGIPKLQWNSFSENTPLVLPAIGKKRGDVAFFYGCIMDGFFGNIHEATTKILQWNGFEVHIPKNQVCCGALDHHLGNRLNMEINHLKNQKVFSKYDTVITNSAGCGAELKSVDSTEFVTKVKDFTEILCEIDMKIPHTNFVNEEIFYDAPCHLVHAQKINDNPKKILKQMGFNIVENFDENLCCGAAGSYVFSEPGHSEEILQRKINTIGNFSNINSIVTANPGCQLQLEKGCKNNNLKIPVLHISEILYKKYKEDKNFSNVFKDN